MSLQAGTASASHGPYAVDEPTLSAPAAAGSCAPFSGSAATTSGTADARPRFAAPARCAGGRPRVAAGPVHQIECEGPHVVPGLSLVGANRRLRAFAGDAHDAAAHEAALHTGCVRGRRPRRRLRSAPARPGTPSGSASLPCLLRVPHRDYSELAVLRHRILVLLPQVLPLHEDVDARRKGVAVPGSKQRHGACVLLAAKHEFRFLFALRQMPVRRHRSRHQHSHDRNAHQERGHRVAALGRTAALTL